MDLRLNELVPNVNDNKNNNKSNKRNNNNQLYNETGRATAGKTRVGCREEFVNQREIMQQILNIFPPHFCYFI